MYVRHGTGTGDARWCFQRLGHAFQCVLKGDTEKRKEFYVSRFNMLSVPAADRCLRELELELERERAVSQMKDTLAEAEIRAAKAEAEIRAVKAEAEIRAIKAELGLELQKMSTNEQRLSLLLARTKGRLNMRGLLGECFVEHFPPYIGCMCVDGMISIFLV